MSLLALCVDNTDDGDDLPMTRADYGLDASTSKDRVLASNLSVGRSSGSTVAPYSADHLSSTDLAAAMTAGSLAMPAVGAAMQGGSNKHYLQHERRSFWGQASYNVGYSYTLGLVLGGMYGVLHGLRASPNNMPRVLLNSILNGSGKFGARAGNAAGVLAMVYTGSERQLEDLEVDKLPYHVNNLADRLTGREVFSYNRADWALPAAAALTTGVLFSIPRAGACPHLPHPALPFPRRTL